MKGVQAVSQHAFGGYHSEQAASRRQEGLDSNWVGVCMRMRMRTRRMASSLCDGDLPQFRTVKPPGHDYHNWSLCVVPLQNGYEFSLTRPGRARS